MQLAQKEGYLIHLSGDSQRDLQHGLLSGGLFTLTPKAEYYSHPTSFFLHSIVSVSPSIYNENHPHAFSIDFAQETHYFAAETSEEANSWIVALRIAFNSCTPSAPPVYPDLYCEETSHIIQQAKNEEPDIPPPLRPFKRSTSFCTPSKLPDSLSEQQKKYISFTEGEALSQYLTRYYFCSKSIQEALFGSISPEISSDLKLLGAYVSLKTLETDNQYSSGNLSSQASRALQDSLRSFIREVQATILTKWHLEAPVLISKVDIWIRRKRDDYSLLLQRVDCESFFKWNSVVIDYVYSLLKDSHCTSSRILQCFDKFLLLCYQGINNSPSMIISKFFGILTFDPPALALQTAHAIFQCLNLENKSAKFPKNDPFLVNTLASVLKCFNQCIEKTPTLKSKRSILSQRELQVMQMLRTYPLIPSSVLQSISALHTINERFAKRLVVILYSHTGTESLQNELLTLAHEYSKRAPAEQLNELTPFPELNPHIEMDSSSLHAIANTVTLGN